MMLREISRFWFMGLTLALLAGCTSSPRVLAPVETRGSAVRAAPPASVPAPEVAKILPGAENAGKPGYYTVQRGDTLTRIALDNGQSWRDLVSWNNLPNAHLIEVGQVLRVAPPGASVETAGVVVQPIGGAAEVAKPAASSTAAPAPATSSNDEGLGLIWPANGNVIGGFDEVKNKGVDIAGQAGDPILAAADGQVVYAGAGLRGYGNLIILKHNNTFLTAYAHNQTLLVKEDQRVRKGQKIAEMGKTDADRVKLHFEVRRQGKPVDPTKYLPVR
jgi:lipoprotein NlpD